MNSFNIVIIHHVLLAVFQSLDDFILAQCLRRDDILLKERYEQEISAYQAEVRMFPDVSVEYKEDRELHLWEYQQLLICSIKYY